MKKIMYYARKIFSLLVLFLGLYSGAYIGGWLMFVKPIIDACKAFSNGMLTNSIIAFTILKCIFAPFIFSIIYSASFCIGSKIYE